MKTSTKIIILAVLALLLGLGLACLGLVFDPFSLPFQDYNQMPLEMQQTYEARAALMQTVRLSGCGVALLAFVTIPLAWLAGRKKQNREKL
jgi:ABC-type Fe3+ transport system permease subunit